MIKSPHYGTMTTVKSPIYARPHPSGLTLIGALLNLSMRWLALTTMCARRVRDNLIDIAKYSLNAYFTLTSSARALYLIFKFKTWILFFRPFFLVKLHVSQHSIFVSAQGFLTHFDGY